MCQKRQQPDHRTDNSRRLPEWVFSAARKVYLYKFPPIQFLELFVYLVLYSYRLETHLQEKKFIVCEDQLMDLFKICPKCCGSANASIAHTVGTLIKVNVTCELCQHSYSWYSQPFLGSVPAGNLAVSSAILYSGALPTKVLRLMNFMNIPTISHQTFFNHQRHILYPAVLRFWKHQQMQHIAKYRDPTESLVLGGDGRADTPGHSAKYGSYSMMDLKQGVVLDIQLVQV